jgi:hypothetical protein
MSEVIESHPDVLKAIAKGCLRKLAGPVVAADAEQARAMLRVPKKSKATVLAGGNDQ